MLKYENGRTCNIRVIAFSYFITRRFYNGYRYIVVELFVLINVLWISEIKMNSLILVNILSLYSYSSNFKPAVI